MFQFQIKSAFKPTGDQPDAINQLINGLNRNEKYQTLLGVTGSGKTFTIANVIQAVQRPTLIVTHNKTLVAQLYGEFKQFFPENAVGYFVSYYDYYQPEAYIPSSKTYIEKDLSINEEIDKLRLQATTQLLSGRRDVIIVASVSCIYGMGNPTEYEKGIVRVYVKQVISRQRFLHLLLDALYHRNDETFDRGSFRVKGDTVDIHLPYLDFGYRIVFFGDEIESIESIIISSGKKLEDLDIVAIFPANLYVAPKEILPIVINEIQDEMNAQITYFKKNQKLEEADRIKERVEHDIEMIRELGYCSGIENYSRFFDRRKPNTRPFCLIDYFPQDFLCIIDESHQTIPQLNGMYGGDRSRKMNLVEYGFRLPSALDNRPLKFDEFENITNQTIYVSATPNDYELNKTGGEIIEQVVRPTGLLDPLIEVRPSLNQIENLIEEIKKRIEVNERVLVTTLTKKMAEELDKYLQKMDILSQYIHSDVDTLDRVEILRNLRLGNIKVLVGVNLLREGLDLPEVSLVAILDADKEGFLRNQKSLTQTAGRAARNVNGFVIFYADKITKSMEETINETQRRREKQIKYNIKNKITPKTIIKSVEQVMAQTSVLEFKELTHLHERINTAAETSSPFDINTKLNPADITKKIKEINKKIKTAIKATDFLEAARLRDELMKLKG